ncbi:MAG: cytochrome ubiquinol oxidase subunit I [Verrucomicrobia bacterium]|nr:cytochrome ubiquinol oxidase subunit I [Kiritimatiellia bacterium]MCP5488089.1 cytochrome ubiquinol oxidase subunit I [Verrucomicrobiota bacterium]
MMDALSLARWQFGITTVYHFIFVPLTLGLSMLVAIMQSFYYRTGKDLYKEMTLFWGKLFVILFTLGVVTGIVQEFQFGMNWSGYSRFVGDIFGIPLAIEALTAFFVESTFLGLWLFGWTRLPKAVHLACIWLVALASSLSSVWILLANAWMQVPVGYVLRNGRAELQDLVAILLNERALVQIPHTILAGFVTGGLFVLGISAWNLLHKHRADLFARSAQIALVFTAVASLAVATTGHTQAQETVATQPMKLAAMEGLWETEGPASMSLFALHDRENMSSIREFRMPYVLSILAHNNLTGEVKGMKELQAEMEAAHGPGDYVPPVAIVYWSFRLMVGLGVFFILLSLRGLWNWWAGKLETRTGYLRVASLALFLPFAANTAGWMVSELGRQPWMVYGLLKTVDGVSPVVGPGTLWISMAGFTVIYGLLAALGFSLVYKFARPARAGEPPRTMAHLDGTHAY